MPSRLLVFVFVSSVVAATPAAAQGPSKDPLGAARDLYASARYDEALAVLDDLHPAPDTPATERRSIEQYRSLCLLALGRGQEAESAIAQVITADPSYVPSEADASPRVRAAFSDVRKRLLPDIASARYADAKAIFDRKDYPAAKDAFRGVMALLDDSDMGGRLPDLKVLAKGFLDLSAAAATPPPAPEPKHELPPMPPPTPRPDVNKIYGADDPDVTAPAVVRQELPRIPSMVTSQARSRGVLEIVIDEKGRVTSAAIRESVHPIYDNLVLTAARDWKYQPGTLDGQPVKYRKLIQINVTKQN
ncbi:MAG TPA: TonB family protein [Vicinamibacterales bacterium]|jgi:TonB family protein|nr:TonB family protein [Vicinamibacterales bacterium]